MTEKEMVAFETAYEEGNRAAWHRILDKCLRELYDDPAGVAARWASEREAVIAALRGVCRDFGDNEWDEKLHLADVIEKHLVCHLHAADDEGGG